jgi:hypothetical protein
MKAAACKHHSRHTQNRKERRKKESRVLPGISFKYFLGGLLLSAFLSIYGK